MSCNEKTKVPVLSYGVGSLGKDLVGGMISMYLLVFYTDVFGISAAAAGLIMMLTRVWDAVNDPMMGTIVDRTNTKWGRYRPYLFVMPVIMGIFYTLTFTTPEIGGTAKIVYAAITYTLGGMAFTAYDVPLWGMVPSMTTDPNERNKLITSQRTFTLVAYLIVGVIAYPAVFALGGGQSTENMQSGFSKLVLLFSIVSVVFAWITFFRCKENIPVSKEKVTVKEMLKALKANKHVQVLLVVTLLMTIPGNIVSALNVYYLNYYLGRPDLISIYMFVSMGSMVVGMITVVGFAKRLGRRKATYVGVGLACIISVVLAFCGKNLAVIFPLLVIYGVVASVSMVTLTSMIADACDYTQWKENMRIDGVIFSLNSFIIKLAMALSSGFAGLFLTVIGYQANAPMQTEATLTGLNMGRFMIPVIPYVIGLLVLRSYQLDDKTIESVREELAQRAIGKNA